MFATDIPAELRDRDQWVVWRYEERDGKTTKVPYQAAKPTQTASSTNPGTWASFEQAVAASGRADGVGYVFAADDPYTGVDFDGCVNGKDVHPAVAELVAQLDSYTEITPSGAGLHVIVRAQLEPGARKRPPKTPWGAEFENYDRERFFTFTGDRLDGTPAAIGDRQAQLDAIYAEIFPAPEPPPASVGNGGPGVDGDDRELLERARNAANGAKFATLWRGDTSGHGGDDSSADLALCSLLRFWAGRDPARIDRLFRQSGLMRDKWDRGWGDGTYGSHTIEKALDGDVYGDQKIKVAGSRSGGEAGGADVSLTAVIDAAREFLHLEHVEHLAFALAVAVSARAGGDPLWGMIVGAPSSSKTEAVRLVDAAADAHLAEVTKAGLLSAQTKKPYLPVGALTRIADPGFITIGDFSTLLASSDRGGRDELYALLRHCYDGRVIRHLGNLPEPLMWEGRLTLLTACTSAIDNYASHSGELGPRWLYLRVPDLSQAGEREAQRRARRQQNELAALRSDAQRLAGQCVAQAEMRLDAIDLEPIGDALDSAGLTLAVGRASVPRNGYGKREIVGEVEIEGTPRIAGQLAHLTRGLLALGLNHDQAAALGARVAVDSMPLTRRKLLAVLATGETLTVGELARRTGTHWNVAARALEELQLAGACSHDGDGSEDDSAHARRRWRLDGERTADIAGTFALSEVTRNVGTYPHSPPNKEKGNHTDYPHTSCDSRRAA